jgi:hypothetical protein
MSSSLSGAKAKLGIPIKTGELPNEITRASNEPAQPIQPASRTSANWIAGAELTKEVAERLHAG